MSAIELGAHAAKAAIERAKIDPEAIEHTIVGNALQTSNDAIYGARHVALKAGVAQGTPALPRASSRARAPWRASTWLECEASSKCVTR